MSAEGVLLWAIGGVTVLLWWISVLLATEAYRKPRITALTVMAVLVPLIAIGLTDYLFAVANAALGYPVPKDVSQFLFRVVLLGIGGWAVWFWMLYRTGRFRDGSE